MGDTIRSWRLREKLSEKATFSPREVLDVHYDTVNPARREIVRLGLHLRDSKQGNLSADALAALDVLEKWFEKGASSDLTVEGAELATRISTFFRFVATPLALKYGGGESGLARFLKDASNRIKANAKSAFGEDECRFIDKVLSEAWQQAPDSRSPGAREKTSLGWFDSLDGFGSLDPAQDLPASAITCLDGQTIKSQAGQSYTQWVPLEDVDSAMTICPIGNDDRPDSPWRTTVLKLWGEGKLHAAPLSRSKVEPLISQRVMLSSK
jgi:hypothetical protein